MRSTESIKELEKSAELCPGCKSTLEMTPKYKAEQLTQEDNEKHQQVLETAPVLCRICHGELARFKRLSEGNPRMKGFLLMGQQERNEWSQRAERAAKEVKEFTLKRT